MTSPAHGRSQVEVGRRGQIEDCLGYAFSEAWILPRMYPGLSRVLRAFRTVLAAMPEQDFEQFQATPVRIIFEPRAWGRLITTTLPPSRRQQHLHLIYLDPAVGRWSHRRLCRLVAHELGHLVMKIRSFDLPLDHIVGRDDEADADTLAASWGFPAATATALGGRR